MTDELHGTVVTFDAEVGLGDVATADGVRYPFHCVEIADGSRAIDIGSPVVFRVLCKLGRYEAAAVTRA